MNEPPQDAWFFTREGERIGPVTFSELRLKVREAGLNPRLDLIWTEGMDEWKPAGEIEGLFEKRAAAESPESLAPPADPYTPPKQGSAAEMMSQEGEWPGARRRSFLLATILFPLVWNLVVPFGAGFLAGPLGPDITGYVLIAAALVPPVVVIYYGLMRLVNLGMSRWWYLANLVPLLNFWVGYRCFACPAGYAYHKKLDGAGVFLAILYWLLTALVILAIIAFIALLFGAINSPELQQQLREIISAARAQATPS